MQYVVRGADRQTGEDRAIEVEADDAATAERQAARAGLLVAEVTPAGGGDREDYVAGFDDEPTAAAETLAYAGPRGSAERGAGPPELRELAFWAGLLVAVSRVVLGLGAVVTLGAVVVGLLAAFAALGGAGGGGGRAIGAFVATAGAGLVGGLVLVIAAAPAAVVGRAAAAFRLHVRRHWNR